MGIIEYSISALTVPESEVKLIDSERVEDLGRGMGVIVGEETGGGSGAERTGNCAQ